MVPEQLDDELQQDAMIGAGVSDEPDTATRNSSAPIRMRSIVVITFPPSLVNGMQIRPDVT